MWLHHEDSPRPAREHSRQRTAIETGVVLARLESVVDRLEGAYARIEAMVNAAPDRAAPTPEIGAEPWKS